MNQSVTSNSSLQYLVEVNYLRMVTFEQAAFNSNDEHLRQAFAERADESESYWRELCAALNLNESEALNTSLCNGTFKNINTRKTPGSMLGFITSFERTVAGWYKRAVADISSLPAELAAMVTRQYKAVKTSALSLQSL